MEDLFRSRFTHFAKFKIVVDPSSRPLETGVIKKIAFVELNSFADQNRVLKWQDLFYQGSRRVVIELADFMDFQNTMEFNQKHADELASLQQGALSHRHRPQVAGRNHAPELLERHEFHRGPALLHHTAPAATSGIRTPVLGAATEAKPSAPKPNPFGNAKPVDINARLHEIEKKLITINHTTIRTAGTPIDKKKTRKPKEKAREKENETREAGDTTSRNPDAADNTPVTPSQPAPPSDVDAGQMRPAHAPPPIYDLRHSLADILSSKPEESTLVRSTSGTPKPRMAKPVILKKQPSVVSSPAHQLELERSHTPADEPKLEPEPVRDDGAPENEPRKEKLDKTRKRRELKSKEPSRTEKEKSSTPRIMERNKSFSSEAHPNFKEHLTEMTQDKLLSRPSSSRRSKLSRGKRRSKREDGEESRANQESGEPENTGEATEKGETGNKLSEKSVTKTGVKSKSQSPQKPGDKALSSTPDGEESKKRGSRRSRGGASRSKRTENGAGDKDSTANGESTKAEKTEDGRNHRGGRSGRGRRKNPRSASAQAEAQNGPQ